MEHWDDGDNSIYESILNGTHPESDYRRAMNMLSPAGQQAVRLSVVALRMAHSKRQLRSPDDWVRCVSAGIRGAEMMREVASLDTSFRPNEGSLIRQISTAVFNREVREQSAQQRPSGCAPVAIAVVVFWGLLFVIAQFI